ncbi:hypothetical protein H8D85_01195 [bacterium]|nr:hypothetical protein [bacterium]
MSILKYRNCYKNKSALIVGCGPSLNEYTKEQLLKEASKDIIISIKQAFNILPIETDFHIINDNNMIQYTYTNDTVVLSNSGRPSFPHLNMLKNCKNLFHFGRHVGPLNPSVVSTGDFSINEIKTSKHKTHMGPGIMLEIVIPFIILSGFSHIKFIGWDYSNPNIFEKYMPHFYKPSYRKTFKQPTTPLSKVEAKRLIKNSEELYKYLVSKNITSEVLSSTSWVSSLFPRRVLNG